MIQSIKATPIEMKKLKKVLDKWIGMAKKKEPSPTPEVDPDFLV